MSNKIPYDGSVKDRNRYILDFYKGGNNLLSPSSQQYGSTSLIVKQLNQDGDVSTSLRNIQSYLTPFDAESEGDFKRRQSRAFYFNIVAQVVNVYSDAVTSKVSRDFGALEPFVNHNVDYRESTWSEFVSQNAKFTALFGMTATYVDYSPVEKDILSIQDLIDSDSGPKCILINPLQFAWVIVSAKGEVTEFAWYENVDESGTSSQKQVQIRVVNNEGWYVASGIVDTSNGNKQKSEFNIVDSGKHPTSLLGKLPVVFNFYDRDYTCQYPAGKSLVNDLVDVAKAVYNYNSMAADIHKSTFPILTVPLARTGGVMPPKTELAVGSSNALPYDSETGTPSFISPSSDPARELREHISYIIRTAYQQLGLTLTLDSSAQIQSGEALKIRSREFESYASKFASNMLKFEAKVINLFKLFLGMDEKVTIIYPKAFSLPATKEDMENAQQVMNVPFISNEGKVAALRQMMNVGLSLTEEETNEILVESEKNLQVQPVVENP